MDRTVVSRRSFVAGATVALAGCSGGDSEHSNESNSKTADRSETPATAARSETSDDADGDASATVDWDEVAEFRKWLTDYSPIPEGNNRFDYQRGYAESFVAGGRVAFLELPPDSVEGHLTQSGQVVHLGTFDSESLIKRIEASDNYERTGGHEGYAIADSTATNSELAVGDDAVLVGSAVTEWIGARHGNRDRLETADPEFTRLFRRLPNRGVVTGQYGSPSGGQLDIDAIDLWGHSMEGPASETATWVYLFEDEASLTDDVLAELETELDRFTQKITDSETDGRVATITATPLQFE